MNPEQFPTVYPRMSRREFLAALGGTAGLLGLGVEEVGAAFAVEEGCNLAALAEADWETIRGKFLLREGLIYLNNGTLGPCPGYVVEETVKVWRRLEENPADEGFGPLLERAEEVRQKAADFLGCSKEEIVITRNTTEGMNTVAQGLNLKRGERVLTTDQEHPGGRVCWEYYARRVGVEIDVVQLPVPPRDAGEILTGIEEKLTKATRVISVSHVTFSTGLKLPVREIAEMAQANGSMLVVDGAQAAGVLYVNVKDLKCHTYATSGHKWLLGPKGTGILYISEEAGGEIDPLFLQHGRGVYTASTGTRNVPAIVGLGAALDFLNGVGREKVEKRALELRDMLYQGLSGIGQVKVVSPASGEMASALVTCTMPTGMESGRVAMTLREKHGAIVRVIPGAPLNGIRVSAHIYNSEEDVEKFLAALQEEVG